MTNPPCTSNANEWLLNQKTIEPKKIKDLDFSQEDFGMRGKKRPLIASPKKRFDPRKNCDLKPLSIKDFAEAIKVSLQSILHTQAKGGTQAKGVLCWRTYFKNS